MIAYWGFDLDMSAVRLMRREGDSWVEEARENIDGADIEERLLALAAKVDNGEPVHLFLPRDQILYTDVKISSEDSADDEIAAAMEGRTPYALDELSIDWTVTEPGTARIAAIAEETLDEAVAFAEARGLAVAGLSSLADPADFPRLPMFRAVSDAAAPSPVADPIAKAPSEAFTTTRTPPDKLPSDGPVLQIDDETPVMRVKSNPMPPLDPGEPLADAQAPPRVRTDIAAGTLSGVAASLTPDRPSVRVHATRSAPWRTLAVFFVAAILTIGVAVIVWKILPMAPGRSELPAPTAPTPESVESSERAEPVESNDTPIETAMPATPELPQPIAISDVATLGEAPGADSAPALSLAFASVDRAMPVMALADPAVADLLPSPMVPFEPRPEQLASLMIDAPVQSLDGTEDVAETTLDIYFASVERRDLAFDAIALPATDGLAALDLPEIGVPPAPLEDTVEQDPELAAAPAALDPVAPLPPAGRLQPTRLLNEPPEALETESDPEPALEEPAPETENVAEEVTAAEPAPVEVASDTLTDPESDLLPRPTALAAALPDRAPRARPEAFTQDIERQQFGGRTRDELAKILPKARPDSAQLVALANQSTEAEASDLAVATSLAPKGRPGDFDALVAAARVQTEAERVAARLDFETPDTSAAIEAALTQDAEPEPRPQDSPRLAIPSSASVARQATIEDAIRLNKINLVGVYGVPSDRRALIRLPSGRYVKVKVGDRVDGGTVAQIGDSELIYRKGSRTVSLTMPKG